MKKMILTAVALTLVGAGIQNARAGDREWALAGKVLTGVFAASVITHAVVQPRPVYYSAPAYSYGYAPAPTVVYAPPPPVYFAPPPVVVYRAPVYAAPVCAPVYVAPAPVVGFRFSVGGGHYRRSRW